MTVGPEPGLRTTPSRRWQDTETGRAAHAAMMLDVHAALDRRRAASLRVPLLPGRTSTTPGSRDPYVAPRPFRRDHEAAEAAAIHLADLLDDDGLMLRVLGLDELPATA